MSWVMQIAALLVIVVFPPAVCLTLRRLDD
jgi:uncharacterized membrane protein YhaH (DUF805 family)